MNLDYTHYGIRNDAANCVYFGTGNNFGPDNLKYKRNYTITGEDYGEN